MRGLIESSPLAAAGILQRAGHDQKTDRKGQATRVQYDALNRIVQGADADGRTTTTRYDLAGNVSLISDSESGDILLAYDGLNRLVRVSTNQGVIGYSYDALGR